MTSPAPSQNPIESALALAKEQRLAFRTREAIELYEAVLLREPENPEAILGLGKSHMLAMNDAAAAPWLWKACSLYPDDAELLTATGFAYVTLTRQNLDFAPYAIEALQAALRIEPDNAAALQLLGQICLLTERDTEAGPLLERALLLEPDSADIRVYLANTRRLALDWPAAEAFAAEALRLEPENPLALFEYAISLRNQGRSEEALLIFRKAAELSDDPVILFGTGMELLGLGEFREGWALFDWGLKLPHLRKRNIIEAMPIWKGMKAPGKRLGLMSEQGLGDVIQFARYAVPCREHVGFISACVRPELARLMKTMPAIDEVRTSLNIADIDLQIPFMSLPQALGLTSLEDIPASVPYFHIPAPDRQEWAAKLAMPMDKMKIGLVWSGSSFTGAHGGKAIAARRNISLAQLKPLLDIEGVAFCNLQLGEAAGEIDSLGQGSRFANVMADVTDMYDTACIIENLDLVITVDTSVAHLAGALGKPVWILSRHDADWRWLCNRADNPWYPSARVFGQPKAGDWDSVITQVAAALKDKAAR